VTQAIGIDIGGTFIDVVIFDGETLRLFKFPSTPDAPERGVLDALDGLQSEGWIHVAHVDRIAHGSTVATNALLERKWADTALITTEGFRDVLEIGRQNRGHLYDLDVSRPDPIVPRDRRFECAERLDAGGRVLRSPNDEAWRAVADRVAESGAEAVAVVFLFSYLNPAHERAMAEALKARFEGAVTLSSDVLPEFREYERTSTTVVCASLRPAIERYVDALARGSMRIGLRPEWQIMQSNGTIIRAAQAQQEPVRILLSGPAAGVEGARTIGRALGVRDLITMDMGGTSCDVALIVDGNIGQTTAGSVGDHPVSVRMNEIHTIGAGGGSIAWIDAGGAVRVGPTSAGAVPGPACYGRGGCEPTVSDAHAVLGHLLPTLPLGGLSSIDTARARDAVRRIAEPLSLSVEEAAWGILEVADAAMERAVRVMSIERGHDPRRFSLLAFGGAGPLHALSIARRLSIPRVIVPATAGVLSAMGLLTCEIGRDYGRTVLRALHEVSEDELTAMLEDMEERGRRELAAEDLAETSVRCDISGDLRYAGQSHELNIRVNPDVRGQFTHKDLIEWEEAFHGEHEARFGHASRDEGVELVALRIRMSAPASLSYAGVASERPAAAPTHATVWFDPSGPTTDTRVIDRQGLSDGEEIRGPALLWGPDATLLVPDGVEGRCDATGTLVLEVG